MNGDMINTLDSDDLSEITDPVEMESDNQDSYEEILIEYNSAVVSNMIDAGWVSKFAKSRKAPFYNECDQSLIGHIAPGVDILYRTAIHVDKLEARDFRDLISLWTIHDIHKLSESDWKDEFEFSSEDVRAFVDKLDLNEFSSDELTIEDFKACAVSLHDSDNSKFADQTVTFTRYRPYLKLVDMLMSITETDAFNDNDSIINSVFGDSKTHHTTATHTVAFNDMVLNTLVNKSMHDTFVADGMDCVNLSQTSGAYVRDATSELTVNNEMIHAIIDNFIDNVRDSYQVFRNKAFLGGEINSPQRGISKETMPRVYELSKLSQICLEKEEIIQRIVQASIDQQGMNWNVSIESENNINKLNDATDLNLNAESTYLEGMATLVHTVYKQIVPELIDETSDNIYERSEIGAIIHIFGLDEELQEQLLDLIESDTFGSSPVSWPYKYIFAKNLTERFQHFTKTERNEKLGELILDRLTDFENWSTYNSSADNIRRELYVNICENVQINGEYISTFDTISEKYTAIENHNEKLSKENLTERSEANNFHKCCLCGQNTNQNTATPEILSHRDADIMEMTFSSEKDAELQNIDLHEVTDKRRTCVMCQIGLSIRAQQFETYEQTENNLHVTVRPIQSVSNASFIRFREIFEYLQNRLFSSDESEIYDSDVDQHFKQAMDEFTSIDREIITDYQSTLNSGICLDSASSKISLPNNTEYDILKGALCASISGLLSGMKVVITKNPQLRISTNNEDPLIRYGAELTELDSAFQDNTDITSLPDQIQMIESVMHMAECTNSPTSVIEEYLDMENKHLLAGSRLYAAIDAANMYYTDKIYDKAATIDSLNQSDDNYIESVVNLSQNLDKITDTKSEKKQIMEHIFYSLDQIETINTADELYRVTMEEIVNTEVDIEPSELLSGGDIDRFAKTFVSTFEDTEFSDITQIKPVLVGGTITHSE